MERRETKRLSEILPQILSDQKLDKRLDETRAAVLWHQLFGEAVAKYTTRVQMRAGVMYVSLSSAVLRNELLCCKASLVQRLNEEVGKPIIRDIIFR